MKVLCPFCSLTIEYQWTDVAPLPDQESENPLEPTPTAYVACPGCGGTVAVPVPEEGIAATTADEGL